MASKPPQEVTDELTWELVRDHWELLLAIGSGPATPQSVASSLGLCPHEVGRSIELLARHDLVRESGDGYGLVRRLYERREGMGSYLRDLVLRRLQAPTAAPIAAGVRTDLGGRVDVASALTSAKASLYPAVVEAANRPESDRSERFSVYFAAASDGPALRPVDDDRPLSELLAVLRAAAAQRTREPDTDAAIVWFAEMRVDPEVATEIGDIFEQFIDGLPPGGDGHGAAGFAIVPGARSRSLPGSQQP